MNRIEALRSEIAKIGDHNRRYFTKKNHLPQEKATHQNLQERVRQIRGELYALKQRTVA